MAPKITLSDNSRPCNEYIFSIVSGKKGRFAFVRVWKRKYYVTLFKQKEGEKSRNLHFKRWEKKGARENNIVFTSELLLLLTKKVRDSINSHSPDPKKDSKTQKVLLPVAARKIRLIECDHWRRAALGFFPLPLSKKKTDEFDHFPNSSPRKKGELDRGNDFSSSPFALLRECVYVRSLKNQGSVVVRREERIQFRCRWFFSMGKKTNQKSHTRIRGGKKERKLHTPLSPPKCEEM